MWVNFTSYNGTSNGTEWSFDNPAFNAAPVIVSDGVYPLKQSDIQKFTLRDFVNSNGSQRTSIPKETTWEPAGACKIKIIPGLHLYGSKTGETVSNRLGTLELAPLDIPPIACP